MWASSRIALALGSVPFSVATRPVFLGVVGYAEHPHIAVFESRGFQSRRHALCRQRAASRGQGRIGLDEFFVQRAERRLIRADRGGGAGGNGGRGSGEACSEHGCGE